MAVASDSPPDDIDVAFTPEAVEIMADALLYVCTALNIPEDQSYERDVIAARIIDLARSGVLDARALRDRILSEARRVWLNAEAAAQSSVVGGG